MPSTPAVGLIGAGRWGKNLARNFYELGALHTLCDTHESHLLAHREKFPKAALTKDYQEILQNRSIGQVVIAAPALKHFFLAMESLQAGKDVYVEKPIALSSGEAEALASLAEEKGLVLMVGHLLHYHPCFRKLQEMIRQEALGKLCYITSNRLDLGPIRTEENALWNFAPHDFSMILSLAGNQMPETVQCTGGAFVNQDIADTALTSLRFASGLRAHTFVSWYHPYKEQRLVVAGQKGMLVFDDTLAWEEKLKWTQNPADPEKAKSCFVQVEKKEPLKEECLHFLECCKKRSTPRTDGWEGVRVTRLLEMADKSLQEGGICLSCNDMQMV